jgi:hypothetical protein
MKFGAKLLQKLIKLHLLKNELEWGYKKRATMKLDDWLH